MTDRLCDTHGCPSPVECILAKLPDGRWVETVLAEAIERGLLTLWLCRECASKVLA